MGKGITPEEWMIAAIILISICQVVQTCAAG